MREFFDSVRQQVSDRMSSPIFGSFLIAWVCWNHQYLVVLFSDAPVNDRFWLIQMHVYPDWRYFWARMLALPLASSLGYIWIYPKISIKLLKYWDERQVEITNLRNEVQKKRLLTDEESQRIILGAGDDRRKLNEALTNHQSEMDALRKSGTPGELETAKQRIRALEAELERTRAASLPNNPFAHLSKEMFQDLREMLAFIAKNPTEPQHIPMVAQRLAIPTIRLDVAVDSAAGAGFVERTGNSHTYVKLTAGGRSYVVREGLDKGMPKSQG